MKATQNIESSALAIITDKTKNADFFLSNGSDDYLSKIGLFKLFSICGCSTGELFSFGVLILGMILIFSYIRYRKYGLLLKKAIFWRWIWQSRP